MILIAVMYLSAIAKNKIALRFSQYPMRIYQPGKRPGQKGISIDI
jgi:hypothetical protein